MHKEKVDREIHNITKKIIKEFAPETIILFGSSARGEAGEDSDVDFLIVKTVGDTRALAREIDRMLFPRVLPIDIVVYRPEQVEQRKRMNDPFILEVFQQGKILYEQGRKT